MKVLSDAARVIKNSMATIGVGPASSVVAGLMADDKAVREANSDFFRKTARNLARNVPLDAGDKRRLMVLLNEGSFTVQDLDGAVSIINQFEGLLASASSQLAKAEKLKRDAGTKEEFLRLEKELTERKRRLIEAGWQINIASQCAGEVGGFARNNFEILGLDQEEVQEIINKRAAALHQQKAAA